MRTSRGRRLGAGGLGTLLAALLALTLAAGCGDGTGLTHTAPPGPDPGGGWNSGGGSSGGVSPVAYGPSHLPNAPDLGTGDGGTPDPGPGSGPGSGGHGPPYPIVLVHGMGGFDTLQGVGLDYFNGVRDDLLAHGVKDVFVTRTSPYDTSEVRAAELQAQIAHILAETGAAKVDLIAHSQGGLDARILASQGGLDDGAEIASITLIGVPNRGTPVADLVMKALNSPLGGVLDRLANGVLFLLERSLYDVKTDPHLRAQIEEMTTGHMVRSFNQTYPDAPGVAYMSYAGRTNFETGTGACDGSFYPNQPTRLDAAQVPLLPTALYIQVADGEANDGMIPVSSARWGTFLRCIPADHGREVGQIDLTGPDPLTGFDHRAFYERVVSRLRAMGF